MGGRKRMICKWVWEQGLKVKMMKLNKKGCLLSQVITSRKDARPGTNSARTCSPSTSNAMLLCSVGGKEQGANREFMGGVEFAEVVAMDQIMLGDSHGSAHSEFRNIYNS